MNINETTGLYDNYGAWHIPFWQTPAFWWGVKVSIALVLLLISLFLLKMYIRYKKSKKLSPKEQLLADLYALKNENKVSVVLGKEFYCSLSEIIKRYFLYCYDYDVLTKTDAELLQYLQQKQVDESLIDEMRDIVHGSQIIKFANAQAAQEKIASDYDRVLGMVQRVIREQKDSSRSS